jgi:Na+/H+ antiporter NhaD/arsenite permease-like protein
VRHRIRNLLPHPAVKALLFERLLLIAAAALAIAALVTGRVHPEEIPGLLDARLLSLFFVLIIAVELGKASDLFDRLVLAVASRVHTARGLAVGMLAVTGALASVLTNDVALFLVVPFTMAFRRVTNVDLTPFVVLEVAAANLLGCLLPLGNPQNLLLFTRGGFHAGQFLAIQAPWVAAAAVFLFAAIPLLVPRLRLEPPAPASFEVHGLLATLCVMLLAAELASLFGWVHHWVPFAFSALGVALLGPRRLRETDFSIIVVFALLFVGVAGLERGRIYEVLNPERIFGHRARGLVLSGALLSQVVSNAPAAMLLAPAAVTANGLRGLLHGVNAGGCGVPWSSIANLIGAQLFAREGGDTRRYWRRFLPLSGILLVLMVLVSLALVSM